MLLWCAVLTGACEKVPLLAPSGSTITLISSATALPINGSADQIAQVIEPSGNPPHSGTLITFTTNLGSVQPSQAETDSGGRVGVKYLAGTGSGSATITAFSGGVSASGANAIKILIGTAAVASVRVTASPTLLPASGGASTITAVVIDVNGNPLSSAGVSFSTTTGSLDSAFGTTDQNGAATTILRTASTATVTAAVGAQAGSSTGTPPAAGGTTPAPATTGTATGTVTVNVAAQPGVSLTSSTTNPTAGTDMAFTASVAPATGSGTVIQRVSIDFDDGTKQELGPVTGTAISLHHVYQKGGTYTVVLTATDSNGSVGTAVTLVFVQAATPLTVLLSAAATPSGTNTIEQFTATVIGLGTAVVLNYPWDFSGRNPPVDTPSNQQTRTYVAGSAPFVLSVTITTSDNRTATGQLTITP